MGEGRKFSMGAASAFAIHATIGLVFTDILSQNPAYFIWIKRVAIGLFLLLAAVFLWQGLHPKPPKPSTRKGASFQLGFFLSAANGLAIPYFFTLGSFLLSNGWLQASNSHYASFVVGAVLGAFGIFQVYLFLGKRITERVGQLERRVNFFLAGLFFLLALFQIVQLSLS